MIPKKAFGLLMFILLATSLILFSQTLGHSLAEYFFGPHGPVIPVTTHIVLFQFKDGTSPFAIKKVTSQFFGLKKLCVHPSTMRPYILSVSGGKDISIENLQNGFSHAFTLQFFTNEDRDYYVDLDPVHQAFKEAAGAVVEKTLVIDFQDGVFTKME
ncbi:stress responsive A/B barrel domain-containing protein [Clathrospora elynae]|uniref:Stress responsive A/B barrel domain-containing protein n=1 Tax=Clathrospora elynae TaxID=706981 RepID=A0A6A5T2B6_9PLEO|nr:stress responsive A/B barrel domain-containing protein [Clathrospora elynae]